MLDGGGRCIHIAYIKTSDAEWSVLTSLMWAVFNNFINSMKTCSHLQKITADKMQAVLYPKISSLLGSRFSIAGRYTSCVMFRKDPFGGVDEISSWMTANLLTLNSSKTEFLLIGLTKQLAKIHNFSLNITHSARNLGFIFDEHLTFSDQISSVSKSCYYHIRQLRCIRPYLDSKTASTIATSIVHSKLVYCNSLYHNLPKSQIARLQQIQNSLARAVVKAPITCNITLILRSLHWLKITERIEYKLLSLYLQRSYNHPAILSA